MVTFFLDAAGNGNGHRKIILMVNPNTPHMSYNGGLDDSCPDIWDFSNCCE